MDQLSAEQRMELSQGKRMLQTLSNKVELILRQGKAIASDPNNLFLFKGMYKKLNDFYEGYNNTYYDIHRLCTGARALFPTEDDQAQLQQVESNFFEACAIYEHYMNPTPEAEHRVMTQTLNTTRTRLPRIEIPEFNGDPKSWCLFRDTFASLVHDDETLTDIEKFHFLISRVKGNALAIIRNIPVQGGNYEQAWDALTTHYDDKRRLAWSYLKTIIEFEPIHKQSAKSLKVFLSTVVESITALLNLGISDLRDFILFSLALRCLDPTTKRGFERENKDIEIPRYDQLVSFVKSEWRTLDLTNEERDNPSPKASNSKRPFSTTSKPSPSPKSSLLAANRAGASTSCINGATSTKAAPHKNSCPVCKDEHSLYNCRKFRKLPTEDKVASLRGWSGCHNCLSSKHTTQNCTSNRRCQTCQQTHHSWLHVNIRQEGPVSSSPSHSGDGSTLSGFCSQGEVLLGTAWVEMRDVDGNFHRMRAVTDSGSQHSFITEEGASRLRLKITPCSQKILGIGGTPLPDLLGKLQCHIRPCISSKVPPALSTEAMVVKRITGNLPHAPLPRSVKDRYKSFALADEEFWVPGKVDLLLGGDLFFDAVTGKPITLDPGLPRLVPTLFGFILAGPTKVETPSSKTSTLFALEGESGDLRETISRFWEIEEVAKRPIVSKDDKFCEEHYSETHYRLPSGRYVVSLPKKDSIRELKEPRNLAITRLLNLETKLSRNASLRKEYHAFMSEYLALGHMRPVPLNSASYTIPHHPVINYIDGNIKLRVVFDASCSSKGGSSLNDHLYAGPKLQSDICEVITNFRVHQVAFVADIVKMFRQIEVTPADRNLQHILWRFEPTEDIQEFELCTVTYGETCSPFLAQRTLRQLVSDEGKNFPRASSVILEDCYVDDIATGAESLDKALLLQEELVGLLAKGGFELSKWASNSSEILARVAAPQNSQSIQIAEDNEVRVKVLGIQWNPTEDIFSYELLPPKFHPTKRSILSAIARMFDPLGYLSPIVFLAKTILQETWVAKCDWDEQPPQSISEKWHAFLTSLPCLTQVQIPRCLTSRDDSTYSIIGFCDASQKGYSAVLYLRAVRSSGTKVHLLKAKTKLAPLHPMTVPRLELCGALLLARLYHSVGSLMNKLDVQDATFFTDSQVVLAWLSYPPEQLKIFVAHRVLEILELTHERQWRFVSTLDNPADCSSRGMLPSELPHHSLWWAGPAWLAFSEDMWPTHSKSNTEPPEVKKTSIAGLSATEPSSIIQWIERFSSYLKLLRSMAYAIRFIRRLKKEEVPSGGITVSEVRQSLKSCLRVVQQAYYPNVDAAKLEQHKDLRSLKPFVDEDGLLRVGGRLAHALLTFDAKHPYLVPGQSHFAKVLINHYHKCYMHIGPTGLQNMLQCRFWLTSARKVIRHEVFKCIKCYKFSKVPQAPLMGNLPSCRLQEGQVFTFVGVDFGGPFYIRESLRRKAALGKAYLCLFVCMVTKALHLEVVSSCTTEAFLAAFSRFVARRGKPAHVFSDCGTNFVGASNRLREILRLARSKSTQELILKYATDEEIQWHFNPPSAPHFGGLWEAGIKSCKALLYKVVGDNHLTFEEYTTIFTNVEAILNSRPLAPLSSDPENFSCLTPGHFLVGKLLTSPPEEAIPSNITVHQRWKLLSQKIQHFWNQWRLHYLHQLQQRTRWTKGRRNLNVGDLVIIKDPNVPQRTWPMARALDVHPGTDGVVRVATIKTPYGIYKRPITKLVSLAPCIEKPDANVEISN